jgi:hypothetical protein
MVSPSTMMTMSWRLAAMPALSAEGLPPFGLRSTRTSGSPNCSTMAAVSSVEPSSTTTTSTGWSAPTSERTVAAMVRLSL